MRLPMNTMPGVKPDAAAAALRDDVALARPRRQWTRIFANAVLGLLALQLVVFLVTNPRFEWSVVAEHLTARGRKKAWIPTAIRHAGNTSGHVFGRAAEPTSDCIVHSGRAAPGFST